MDNSQYTQDQQTQQQYQQDPQYQAPQYQPQYQTPQYQAPQYQAPQYQAPQYQAPQYQAPQYQAPQYQAPQYQQPIYQQPAYQSQPIISARQLFTSRSLLTTILLSLLTMGIYGIVMNCHCSEDINTIAERYDGKHTLHWFVMCALAPLTLGILPFVWSHRISNRIGNELIRRNINYTFNASTFWLWSVLGSLIIVGPFVYMHKFYKALNLLSADYNVKG